MCSKKGHIIIVTKADGTKEEHHSRHNRKAKRLLATLSRREGVQVEKKTRTAVPAKKRRQSGGCQKTPAGLRA